MGCCVVFFGATKEKENPDAPSEEISPGQCKALTKAGSRCSRKSSDGLEFCLQHAKIHDNKPSSDITTTPSRNDRANAMTPADSTQAPTHTFMYFAIVNLQSLINSLLISMQSITTAKGKARVFVRVRGVRDLHLIEQTIGELVRDQGISKRRADIERLRGAQAYYTDINLRPATRAATAAAATAAKSHAVTAASGAATHDGVHVDHTFECQMLGHAVVQTEAFHARGAEWLRAIDLVGGIEAFLYLCLWT